MSITKSNGTLIKKNSKKQKDLTLVPNLKLGNYSVKNDKIVTNNTIVYQDETKKFKKDKIITIVTHPTLTYKKKKYLVKKVIVLTETNLKLEITSVKNGHIRGILVK